MERVTLPPIEFKRARKLSHGFRAWSQGLEQRMAERPATPPAPPPAKNEAPLLVVRLMPAVYHSVPIKVHVGEAAMSAGLQFSFVQHPQPYDEDGHITPSCRELIVNGVLELTAKTKLRVCIVWKEGLSTYVEPNGALKESTFVPNGGMRITRGKAL